MGIIKLSQQKKRVEISSFEISNEITFNYFNNLTSSERDEKLVRAINIGVLALMEDRFSAFLSKTTNELGTELENLKIMFDMKQEIFNRSSIKGAIAEEDIAEFLSNYFLENKINDDAVLTGSIPGELSRNKTGDIVCHINGNKDLKIAIECKFDKGIRLGDIKDKDVFTKKTDTAWSQLIEAQANRGAAISIIVFDTSSIDGTLLREIQNIKYIPEVGFVVIVDSLKGDYTNLATSYMLSRDIAINAREVIVNKDLLKILINRLIKDITDAISIKKMISDNIENNKKILTQLEKSVLMMDFNKKFLLKFLSSGSLTKEELLDFYFSDEVKDEFRIIEREIKNI